MQEITQPQHETIFVGIPAETLESLDRIQAGLGASCRCWKWKANGPRDATAFIACWR